MNPSKVAILWTKILLASRKKIYIYIRKVKYIYILHSLHMYMLQIEIRKYF